MDWYSRKILAWNLSNTVDAECCVACFEKALFRHGSTEIFNSDQGSQYTSEDFIKILQDKGIKISMDGKGCFIDNIFIERLWRSLKYKLIYIQEFSSVRELRLGLKKWIGHDNRERFHQSLNYQTPDEV